MKRKNIIFSAVLLFLILAVSGALVFHARGRVRRMPISAHVDENLPMVALTFNDGPNPSYTPQVLDLLYENDARATFFLLGEALKDGELLAEEMVSAGHEIGNHTDTHPDLTKISSFEVQYELYCMEKTLQKIVPDVKVNWVRPPYGFYTDATQKAAGKPLALWNLDSMDWRTNASAEIICDTILKQVKDGDVIVFHDDNAETVKALKTLLPALREKGFQFVTLTQMERYRPLSDNGLF